MVVVEDSPPEDAGAFDCVTEAFVEVTVAVCLLQAVAGYRCEVLLAVEVAITSDVAVANALEDMD